MNDEQHSGAQNLARPFGLRPKFRHTLLQHLPRLYTLAACCA